MRLKIVAKHDQRDGRHQYIPVIDEDTGQEVGKISSNRGSGRIIRLFGERYTRAFQTPEECVAFVEGVQAVLNEMTSTEVKRPHGAEWPEYPVIKLQQSKGPPRLARR